MAMSFRLLYVLFNWIPIPECIHGCIYNYVFNFTPEHVGPVTGLDQLYTLT